MGEPLKNVYDKSYVKSVAKALREAGVHCPEKEFCQEVFSDGWKNLELLARTTRLKEVMAKFLPEDFREAVPILIEAGKDFSGYEGMFFPEYVETYGLDHWDLSMEALEVLTTYSSAEFAIRPFLLKDPERGIEQMISWSQHDNRHVRRLASEGARPRLPWAKSLPLFIENPKPLLPILENLKKDKNRYVQKSVANHLNDISKDHPALALKVAKGWMKKPAPETVWIVKHGLRTLLKEGEQKALSLFGYGDKKTFDFIGVELKTPLVIVGEELEFHINFEVLKESLFRLEYALHFRRKGGDHGRKVFKISEKEITPGVHSQERQHSFRVMSTRQYYEGVHFIEIIINGVSLKKVPFVLWESKPAYQVYMLLTQKGTLYTGITTDLNRRFQEHMGKIKGKGAKYTKGFTPELLVYLTGAKNRSEASKEEARLKKLSRKEKEKLGWFTLIN